MAHKPITSIWTVTPTATFGRDTRKGSGWRPQAIIEGERADGELSRRRVCLSHKIHESREGAEAAAARRVASIKASLERRADRPAANEARR